MQLKSTQWLSKLLDDKSFIPYFDDRKSEEGLEVTIGFGTILNKPVAIYAQNIEFNRGYISKAGGQKILRLMKEALSRKVPIIALLASPGIDIENDMDSGITYTEIISQNIALSGVIPQLAVIMSPTLGAPAYSSVLMDLSFFNELRSYLMVTSPAVVKQAIGETASISELGGVKLHASETGLADFLEKNTIHQLDLVKQVIEFLPNHFESHPDIKKSLPPQKNMPLIPSDPMKPFDMTLFIEALVDSSTFIEYKKHFGLSMICAFARIDGLPIGIVANQGKHLGGAIDCDAAQKSSRFLRVCDAYNIPIVTLLDVPGFMPGKREEQKGLLRHGARFCTAMQTTVPRLSVIVRKAFGAAGFLMMQTKAQGGDLVLALNNTEVGVMGKKASAGVREAEYQTSINETNNTLASLCDKKIVDEVVESHDIRAKLAFHLKRLFKQKSNQRLSRKHFIEP